MRFNHHPKAQLDSSPDSSTSWLRSGTANGYWENSSVSESKSKLACTVRKSAIRSPAPGCVAQIGLKASLIHPEGDRRTEVNRRLANVRVTFDGCEACPLERDQVMCLPRGWRTKKVRDGRDNTVAGNAIKDSTRATSCRALSSQHW